ncbi:hypothetical protein Tco_0582585 [Tanacetum coccineum]
MGKGLLGPNDGSYGGKGRRGGSMAGRGDGWLAKRSIVSNEGCGRGGLVVLGGKSSTIGEDCLDGCDGAGRGEVNGGGVVLGVFKSLLGEILGEVMGERCRETIGVDGGTIWQQARTLILVVLLNALTFFLSFFDFGMVKSTDQPVPCAEWNRPSILKGTGGMDKSKIARKQSKTGKHGHENQKSSKRSQRIKAEARKAKPQSKSVKPQSNLVNKSQQKPKP